MKPMACIRLRRPAAGGRRWRFRGPALAVLAVAAGLTPPGLAPAPALAQQRGAEGAGDGGGGVLGAFRAAPGERAVITADELTHDRGLDMVTARGKVEIQYAGRILLADSVNYRMGADEVSASGNVVLTEPDGSTLFSEYVQLTGEMRDGFAREVRILLKDGSQAAAREARRSGGQRTDLDRAVYSACDACLTDPAAPRVWQVKAVKVVHDQAEKDITYHDAWLEMFGVPVLYTPWLSHPDPSVERRSGFLAPTYGGARGIGASITVPYYFALSNHQDLTFAPMFTTDEGVVLGGEYRLAAGKGEIFMAGSLTQDSEDRVRNHLFATVRTDINRAWRAGAEVQLASDDTYLRRYGYENPAFLTSRPYLEGFDRRSYTLAEAYYFQNQVTSTYQPRAGDPPVAVPLAEWSYTSAPGVKGAWHTAEISAAALTRDGGGTDSRRLSAEYGWHLPHVGPVGDLYQLDLSLRGDAYSVEDVATSAARPYTGNQGRVVPQAALTWSMPWVRHRPGYGEVFEPIVMGVISPRGQNPEEIPNEDSLDFEFEDTNLFSANRFTGHDRVEGGARVNYGLRYDVVGSRFGTIGVMGGQTYHATGDGLFNANSGIREAFSDYVGRVEARPGRNLDLLYRFRLDKDSLDTRFNEARVTVGPPALRVAASYLSLTGEPLVDGGPAEREELAVAMTSRLSRYWMVGASTRWNLGDDGGPLRIGGMVGYEDECFVFTLNGAREYTYDLDYEGGYRFGLRLVFKTLGEVQTSASP